MRTHLTAVLSHTLSASSPTWHQHAFFNLLLLNNFNLPLFQFLLASRPIFLFFMIFYDGFFWGSFPFSSLLLFPRIPAVLVDDLSSSSRVRWCIIESSLWIYHPSSRARWCIIESSCGFIIIQSCSLMYHRVVFMDLSSSSCVGWYIIELCWWIYHPWVVSGLYHHGVV